MTKNYFGNRMTQFCKTYLQKAKHFHNSRRQGQTLTTSRGANISGLEEINNVKKFLLKPGENHLCN